MQVGLANLRSLEQEDVFVINDNSGRLYEMRRMGDGQVVVPDPSLYRETPRISPDAGAPLDEKASIGAVSKTDILTIELMWDEGRFNELSSLGVISMAERHMPAGLAALTSFAHHLRVVAANELDVDTQELRVGIQPVSAAAGSTYTGRIFLADSLENGAGYASHIGEPEFFGRLLVKVLDHGAEQLASQPHSSNCDTSCPDCLRSYENRQVHPLLDWRLGLDISELAAGRGVDFSRWLGRTDTLAAPVLETLSGYGASLERFGEIDGILTSSTGKVALLGHPLWSSHADYFNPAQALAFLEAGERVSELGNWNSQDAVKMWDLWTVSRHPEKVIEWLNR